MEQLTFRGCVDGSTSYYFHLENVVRWFKENGHHTVVHPITLKTQGISKPLFEMLVHQDQPDKKEVIIHDPTFDAVGDTGKEVCFVTMWETTRIPDPAVENLNKAKVVVVPSKWQVEVFSAQGVTAPLRVVPMGVNPDRFAYDYRERSGPFTFGTAGNLAVGGCRKNIEAVIDAFELLGAPDTKLVIKTYPGDKIPEIENPSIEVTQEFVSKKQIPEFYQGIDCFVSATRGEGWGLMQHEAMLSGKPVISTNFGGISEFFDASVGYPVDYDLVSAGKHYENCGLWADPSIECLRTSMERAQSWEGTYEKARAARERALDFTWEASNKKLLEVLEEFDFIDG